MDSSDDRENSVSAISPDASGVPKQSADGPHKKRKVQSRAKPAESPTQAQEDETAMSSSGLPHVHPPHGSVHSWRDFFVHIAIIAIGLLLALGLERIALSVHHASQRAELEAQMRETFESNALIDRQSLQSLNIMRNYLVGLHTAVEASRKGHVAVIPAPPRYNYVTSTSLGPFDAAQANGTIAVMKVDRIRLYNRIASQHAIAVEDLQHYRHSVRSLRAFRKRFETAHAIDDLQFVTLPPDLALLTADELVEYQTLIGNAIEAIDQLTVRMERLANQARAVLNGARDEEDLVKATIINGDNAHQGTSTGGN